MRSRAALIVLWLSLFPFSGQTNTPSKSWQAWVNNCRDLLTRSPYETVFLPGDCLVFGSETKGISDTVRASFGPGQSLKLPMLAGQRSLNVSNAVAVTVFEAWRQNGFATVASSPTA